MEAILVSTGIVALSEIGDKTQLLAFLLAARFRKPLPIILGIFFSTVLNHGLAGVLGAWVTTVLTPEILRLVLSVSFLGMAVWTLVPDKMVEEKINTERFGVFGATFITFFLAEMGDKTQIATIAIAAHYAQPFMVVIGTTLGIMIADVPAVFIGEKISGKVPLKWIRILAALLFVILAVFVFFELDKLFT